MSQNKEESKQGREIVQCIENLYLSAAKLWTKEMFRDIEEQLAKEPRPDAVMMRSSTNISDLPSLIHPLACLFQS